MWCDSHLSCRVIQSSYFGREFMVLLNWEKIIKSLLFYDRFRVWTALLILPCCGWTVSHVAPTTPNYWLPWLCVPHSLSSLHLPDIQLIIAHWASKINSDMHQWQFMLSMLHVLWLGILLCLPTSDAQDNNGYIIDQCASPNVTCVTGMPFKTNFVQYSSDLPKFGQCRLHFSGFGTQLTQQHATYAILSANSERDPDGSVASVLAMHIGKVPRMPDISLSISPLTCLSWKIYAHGRGSFLSRLARQAFGEQK